MEMGMRKLSYTFALIFMTLISTSVATSEVPFMVVHKNASL
ncbi:unnamed protein product [Arabidopsis halleri]